jgi:hypothetical protein
MVPTVIFCEVSLALPSLVHGLVCEVWPEVRSFAPQEVKFGFAVHFSYRMDLPTRL